MSRLSRPSPSIWRLALPYFCSEDRRAGRILLAAVIADRAVARRHHGADQQLEHALLQRAAGPQLGCVRQRAAALLRPGGAFIVLAVYQLYLQPVAADPLAALDDAQLSRPLADRRQPLPHAASRRRRRQSGPAHRRGHPPVRRARALSHRHRPAQRRRHVRLLRRHPVDAVGGGAAATVRHDVCDPRLSGLGGADLCGRRHRADASGSAGR